MLTKLRQYLGILIAGILLFFLIKPFVQTHNALKNDIFQVLWRWLIPSFGVMLLYRSLYVYPFTTLLRHLSEKQVPFRTAFTLFHLANITRYLPGRIWGVVRLLALSKQFGLSKTAVGGSLTLHVGIETAIGGLLAMALLFSKQMRDTAIGCLEKMSGHALLLTLAGLCIMAGVFLIPTVSSQARQAIKTLQAIGTLLLQKSFLRTWGNIMASQILLWMCQGLAFYLFVRSLASVQWIDAGGLTACYAFAWIVGFLSFLTPGGSVSVKAFRPVISKLYASTARDTYCPALSCLDAVGRDCFGSYRLLSQEGPSMFPKHLKHIAIACGISFILLFLFLLPHTQTQSPVPTDEKVTVTPHHRPRAGSSRLPRSVEQPARFQDSTFYRTLIDNNLLRLLGWTPPRSKEPYSLIGTITPTTGKTVSPQAILLATAGNKTHIVTIGEKLDKDTKVTDIRPRRSTLEKDGQPRTLKLNTAPWLK